VGTESFTFSLKGIFAFFLNIQRHADSSLNYISLSFGNGSIIGKIPAFGEEACFGGCTYPSLPSVLPRGSIKIMLFTQPAFNNMHSLWQTLL